MSSFQTHLQAKAGVAVKVANVGVTMKDNCVFGELRVLVLENVEK